MFRALAVTSRSVEETRILGAALAPALVPGDALSLSGDLGAGKTVYVQGIATAMGVEQRVTSPTFTIVHEYTGRYKILHVDVYRLNNFQEVIDLGFEEFWDPEAVTIVEWGEAVAPLLPRSYVEIDIRRSVDTGATEERNLVYRPRGHDWVTKLETMRKTGEALLNAASAEDTAGERFSYVAALRPRDDRGMGEGLEA